MKAAIIEDGIVTNLIVVDALDILPGLVSGDGAGIGDTWDGAEFKRAPGPPPAVAQYVVAVQAMLDTKVQERRYYNILSACTYSTSTNATFKAEAAACMAWRDAVWAKAYAVLDDVNAGALAQPTIPELLAMLPALEWPNA